MIRAKRILRIHLIAYQAPPQTISAKHRPFVFPAMVEDAPLYRVAVESAEPFQEARALNPSTVLKTSGRRVDAACQRHPRSAAAEVLRQSRHHHVHDGFAEWLDTNISQTRVLSCIVGRSQFAFDFAIDRGGGVAMCWHAFMFLRGQGR